MKKSKLSSKEFLGLAIPFMISTMTQPLLGAVDTGVAGRLENASFIAGISVGSNIFNTLYWMLGFLRVSTTAFSAQAMGKHCAEDTSIAFYRPIFIAITMGLLFLLFQTLILEGSLWLISPDEKVKIITRQYYKWVIWGAPFVLSNYVILGWLMGQRYIKSSMTMQISGNLLNAFLSILLALVFNYGIKGIAVATLLSQVVSTGLGVFFLHRSGQIKRIAWAKVFDKKAWIATMKVNENLMKRTACLLVHNNLFIVVGASFGTTLLAVNSILFQINSVTSYMFDGLANTASVYTGKAVGEKNSELLEEVSIHTRRWAWVLSGLIILIYALFQNEIFGLFTSLDSVISGLKTYGGWFYLYPLVAGMGLSTYGIFTGAGETRSVFLTTFQSLLGFLVVLAIGVPTIKNHGLWLALMTFYGLRSLLLVFRLKSLNGHIEKNNQ